MTEQNKDLKKKAKLWFDKIVNRPYQGLDRDCTIEMWELEDRELYNYLLDNGYIQPKQETHIDSITGEIYTITKYKRRWCFYDSLLLFSLFGIPLLGVLICIILVACGVI